MIRIDRQLRPHFYNTVIALTCLGLTGCVVLHGNFRTVQDGAVYRSGQLSPAGLERRLEKHSIRTVVSLRGPDEDSLWYPAEKQVCEEAGAAHIDLPWTMKKLPPPESLARLIEIYEHGEAPVLVHCQGGNHRAAVAAAIYVLLDGGTPHEAREQFGTFFNDAPIGALIGLYEGSDKPFAQWAKEDYPSIYAKEEPP
jgi:protein tyrosine phosphatase (PTP) superfamily phosphohydrolase (DUF442 family)